MATRRQILSGLSATVATALLPGAAFGYGSLAEGSRLPAVRLSRSDGSGFELSQELAGKVGLISFWALWCGACLSELPSLDRLHQRLAQDPGIRLLAINVDQGVGLGVLRDFWKRGGFKMPLAIDASGSASALFRVSVLPMAFIVAADGTIRYALPGARTWDSEQWARGLQSMVAEGKAAAG